MTDILVQVGVTKLALSGGLAGTVWLVTRRLARPAIAHSLWLLVLGALLVPAVFPLRVLPERADAMVATAREGARPLMPGTEPVGAEPGGRQPVPQRWVQEHGRSLAILAWLLGSAGFFGWTLARTVRFQRTLMRVARPAPELQRHAGEIGRTLGLSRVPRIYTTSARWRPMVWWTGGRVRILIPSAFIAELDAAGLRAVLAHELAHVRRRDYVVRVVEWLACTAYWWNPIVWWTRRELRLAEESCCDVQAVSATGFTRREYAASLLRAVEVMSERAVRRTPALASAAYGHRGSRLLEKRLRTVLASKPGSTGPDSLRAARRVALSGCLALGLVYCDVAEQLVVPRAGEPEGPATVELTVGAPAKGPGLIMFLPALDRDWFVAWNELTVASGPSPPAIAVEPAPNCHLDLEERNGADLVEWANARHDQHSACIMAWADRMDSIGVPRGPNGGCIGFDVAKDRAMWACTSMTPEDIESFMKVGAVGYALREIGPRS